MEDVFLDATEGDDFVGVQTYSRTRVGPDGVLGPEDGVADAAMGYEFWPEALEATIRRAWEVHRGRGADPRHRERHRHRRRRPAHRATCAPRSRACSTASPTASTCAATRTGACSTTSSGPSATAPASASSTATARPSSARPKPSARWLGRVAQANACWSTEAAVGADASAGALEAARRPLVAPIVVNMSPAGRARPRHRRAGRAGHQVLDGVGDRGRRSRRSQLAALRRAPRPRPHVVERRRRDALRRPGVPPQQALGVERRRQDRASGGRSCPFWVFTARRAWPVHGCWWPSAESLLRLHARS